MVRIPIIIILIKFKLKNQYFYRHFESDLQFISCISSGHMTAVDIAIGYLLL